MKLTQVIDIIRKYPPEVWEAVKCLLKIQDNHFLEPRRLKISKEMEEKYKNKNKNFETSPEPIAKFKDLDRVQYIGGDIGRIFDISIYNKKFCYRIRYENSQVISLPVEECRLVYLGEKEPNR